MHSFSEIERMLLTGLDEQDRCRTEDLVSELAEAERAQALKAGARLAQDRAGRVPARS